jgi:dTDP-4-dehydrorhamnose reductase
MKILVTGGSGMLGKALIPLLSREHRVSYTVHSSPAEHQGAEPIQCDLSGRLSLPGFEAVVHTAALTDVDYCQGHPEEAYRANVTATQNLVQACPGAYLLYISSDFVFDGEKGCYTEEDLPNPISEYGRTKYLAEKEIPKSGCSLRTSIYGLGGNGGRPTFIEKALARLEGGQEIYGFDDQWFSPMSIYNLAELVAEIIIRRPSGVLHLGGPERLSKHQFMSRLAGAFGHPESLVKANSFRGYKFAAPRPRDASLNNGHAASILKTPFWSLSQSFTDIKKRLASVEKKV